VKAEVALRNIGSTAPDLIDLRLPVGCQGDPCPDCVAVGCGQQPYQDGMSIRWGKVLKQRRRLTHVDDHNFLVTVVVQVPNGEPARRVCVRNAASGLRRQIEKLPVSSIPVEQPSLFELFSAVSRVHFGIHVSIGEDQILPPIVIDIHRRRTPSQIPGVHRQAASDGGVGKVVVPLVVVEGGGVVRKVGLENIEAPVMAEVGCGRAHPGLFAPLLVIGHASRHADLLKTFSLQIMEVKAGRGIAGYVDIGPTIVVEIGNQRSETVIILVRRDVHVVRDIGKVAVSVVLIQRDRFPGQTSWAANHRKAFPLALRPFSWVRCLGRIEFDVVDNHKVERAIPIKVDKRASRAPAGLRRAESTGFGLILKRAVSKVMVENIFSPPGNEEVDIPVVVEIPGANTLPPSGVGQSGPLGDIFKLQATQVVVKHWSGRRAVVLKSPAIDKKNVGQTIVVVVEDRNSRPSGFNDVLLVSRSARDVYAGQSGLGSNVLKAYERRFDAGRQRLGRRSHTVAGRHPNLCVAGGAYSQVQEKNNGKTQRGDAVLPCDERVFLHILANSSIRNEFQSALFIRPKTQYGTIRRGDRASASLAFLVYSFHEIAPPETLGAIPGGIVNRMEGSRSGAGMICGEPFSSPNKESLAELFPSELGQPAQELRMFGHPIRRWPALCIRQLLFAGLCGFPLTAMAQGASTCKGPASLEQTLASKPSPGAYESLGVWFATQRQFSCAASAFESAIHLDPNSWQSHFDLGIALLSSGKFNRAADELRTASGLKPDSEQILLPLGAALAELNQQDEAIGVFRSVLKVDPQSVKALDGLTKALIAEKRYTAAIAELKNAPPDEVLQLNLAVAYLKNGNTSDALKTVSAIVKEHPGYAQAQFNLGVVYSQQERFAEAAQAFQEAMRLDPTDDVTRLTYVKTLVVLAQFETAAPIIRDYLHRHPHDFDALYSTGVVEKGLGNNAEAEKVLRQAVAINPNSFDARYNLGFALAHLGRPAEAKPQLEAAIKLSPDSDKARFQLASVLRALGLKDEATQELNVFQQKKQEGMKQTSAVVKASEGNQDLQSGDPQKAAALYREAIAADPNNGRTYYNLALALDRIPDYGGEREALEKAVQLDPQLALPHNQLGLVDLQANQGEDAEKQFKEAIALDPQYAEAQNNLGVLYGQLGKSAEAEQLFRQATENNPQYGQAFANLGLILASESRYADAGQALASAVQLDPGNTGTLSAYGMVLVRLNRASEALTLFRKVAALDPKSSGAHLNLGIALADQNNLDGALAEFSEAVRLDPNSAIAHYNKGRVLLDLRRNGEAKPELDAATHLDSGSADCWYLLGLISREAGETDESIRQFEKALAAKPDNAEALFMLGQQLLRKGDTAGAIERWRKAIEIRPQYDEVYYSLARLLAKSDPDEAKRLQERFEEMRAQQHITDRAQMLGNFALASADAHDWPKAVAQLKEAMEACGKCSALPLLHKDLGLIYCHSGDYRNGKTELLEAQKLSPDDEDIKKALRLLEPARKPQ
jgi:tetratricopeptide (TPR) repeat protein